MFHSERFCSRILQLRLCIQVKLRQEFHGIRQLHLLILRYGHDFSVKGNFRDLIFFGKVYQYRTGFLIFCEEILLVQKTYLSPSIQNRTYVGCK